MYMTKNYCKSVTCKNFEIWLKDVHNKKKSDQHPQNV